MNTNPSVNGYNIEFTRQEFKVLKLASKGLLNKEITDNLGIEE